MYRAPLNVLVQRISLNSVLVLDGHASESKVCVEARPWGFAFLDPR
jgi:hypothetical protein